MPRIDQIVDSTAACDLLCFLDAFSGYHQGKIAKEDEEKTAFLTPYGLYCYVCMPFGLKNDGATFQRLMRIALGEQMGRNAEAYVDDIVVKSREGDTLLRDLEETFTSLRRLVKISSRSLKRLSPSRDLTTMSSTYASAFLPI